jgi:hypothetical protein
MENGIQLEALKKFLSDYWKFIKKYTLLYLVLGILGLSLGVFYAYRYKPYYIANLSFILNDAKSSSGGTLSALAGQLGLSSGSPNITDDRVLYLGKTKRILAEAMLKKMGNSDVTIADKLAEVLKLKNGWANDTTLFNLDKIRAKHIFDLTYKENKAIDQIIVFILKSNRLQIESVSKKSTSFVGVQNSGIIQLTFESRDEQLSLEFVKAIYKELSEFYISTMTKNLQANYDLISFKTDSIKSVLNDIEEESAISSDVALNMFRYKGKLSDQRLRRDLNILNILYAESIKNKELAKFNLEQDRPVFQLVDTPMAPLDTKGKSMLTYGFLGCFVLTFIGIGGLSLTYLYRISKKLGGNIPA